MLLRWTCVRLSVLLAALLKLFGCEPEPPPASSVTVADVRGLARDPRRLFAMVDPARGLVVARSVGCESDEQIELAKHVCGRAVRAELVPILPGLREQAKRADLFEDQGGIACVDRPRAQCTVPATSECEANYILVFDTTGKEPVLRAVIERDDWQSQEEYQTRFTQRVEKALAAGADGC